MTNFYVVLNWVEIKSYQVQIGETCPLVSSFTLEHEAVETTSCWVWSTSLTFCIEMPWHGMLLLHSNLTATGLELVPCMFLYNTLLTCTADFYHISHISFYCYCYYNCVEKDLFIWFKPVGDMIQHDHNSPGWWLLGSWRFSLWCLGIWYFLPLHVLPVHE